MAKGRPAGELKEKIDELKTQLSEARKGSAEFAQIGNILEVLHESESNFWTIFNQSSVGAVIVNLDRCFIKCNDAFARLLNSKPEEIVGKTIEQITYPEDRQLGALEMRSMLEGKLDHYTTQKRYLTSDNRIVWGEISINLLKNEKGEPQFFLPTIIDITEYKMAEEALAESEEKFRILAEQLPDLVWWKDLDGIYRFCNNAFARNVNLEPHQVIGKTDYDLYPYDSAEQYCKEDLYIIREKKPLSIEEYSIEQGEPHWYQNHKTAIFNEKGRCVGTIGISREVTENKKAEEKLLQSQQDFRTLFEQANDPIIVFLPESEIVIDVNQRACEVYGFSKEEFIGMSLELISKNVRSGKNKIKQTLQLGGCIRFETYQYNKDGQEIILEVNAKVIKYRGENAILSINRDITERQQAQLLLQKRERMYNTLIENLPGFIYQCKNDRNWTMTFISAGCKQITGYSSEELTDNRRISYNKLILENYQEIIWNKWQELLKSRSVFEEEYPIRTATGQIKWVWERGRGIFDDRGKLLYLEGYIEDVSKRRHVEEALQESEARLSKIVDAAQDAIIITDSEANIVMWNNSAVKMFGYSAQQAFGKNFHSLIRASENQTDNQWYEEFHSNDQGKFFGSVTEMEGIKMSGESFPIELSLSAIKLKDSWYSIGVIRDITQRKISEKELIAAKEQAEQSDKLKSAFLANMSHEIRTPMNGIIGFSEMFMDREKTEQERAFYAQIVIENSNRLLRIVNDILDISSIEAGKLGIIMDKVNVNQLLTEIHVFFKPQMEEKSLILFTFKTLTDNQSIIKTDKTRLEQIISNLLNNAIKFTSKGHITLGYELKDSFLQFSVEDTGIGIPQEMHEVVFERFRKVEIEITRQNDGTGLGLSITKKLVELLGGKIWFESRPGKGSTFYFTLPYNPEHIPSD